MSPTAEWITELERFAAVAAAWDRLAIHDPLPFSSHAWIRCWWDAFEASGRVAICALWEDGELAAACTLVRAGRSLSGMVNAHTPAWQPVARDPEALDRLITVVAGRAGAELRGLRMPADGPGPAAFQRASHRSRRRCVVEPEAVSLIADTRGDYDAYRARMKANLRETERRRRKAQRELSVRWRLIERPTDLDGELDAVLRVEASGWKGREGTAIVSDARVERFYRTLARALHDRGELRLSALWLDDELAAGDFAFVNRGRYWLLKTGYLESVARLGPGMALRLSVIERCFSLGLEAHEFLGVDAEWKRRFATSERRLVNISSYASKPLARARALYRGRLRPMLKRARDEVRRQTRRST